MRGSIGWTGQLLVKDLNFKAPAGRWTCLLGPSGVGKSTLLRLFAGLRDGILFEGTLAPEGLEGRVALMAQGDGLLPWLSALDNVLIGARLRGAARDKIEARALLHQVGLSEHSGKRPHQLSGGQRQRVALARVLMEDRPIVLLDEPFSALDALTRSRMQDLAADLLQDRTVLMVTHDPSEAARLGHNILIMWQGGLETVEPPMGPIPRDIDAQDVMHSQARLLKKMRDKT